MARGRKTQSDDSEEETRRQVDSEGEEAASGDESEEYEIEAILDAEHGAFPGGELGYWVKWRNYDESHNSWVKASDAGNAKDLIEEFWKKQPKVTKSGRKSDVKESGSAARRRKTATPEESDAESAPAPKKRGRPSKTKPASEDDEMDVEEVPPPKKPRAEKKISGGTASSKVKSKRVQSVEPMDEDAADNEKEAYTDMSKYKNAETWEHIVDHIDTVERQDDGQLYVYFRLKSTKKGTKPLCREPSSICKAKMPQMLITFYEQNLRWRPVEDENGEVKD